ncbi:MAG: hypothetical protein ACREVE_07125 [Gammaproteobacteria bacterium]
MQPYLLRTFLERGNGLHFASPPPADITDRRYLQSHDLDEVLACVLANLQKGRFDLANVPMRLVQLREVPGLWVACAALLGFSAPMRALRSFVDEFGGRLTGASRFYVCDAAMSSGAFWAVETILAAYPDMVAADFRRFLGHGLSWLLEQEPGPAWDGPDLVEVPGDPLPPGEQPETRLNLDAYMAMVREQARALRRAEALRDESVVAEGRVLVIKDVAQRLLDRLRRGERGDRIEKGRMLLEATTGLNCGAFFNKDYMLQPLAAAAIVEEFLDSGEAEKYEAGVRYFFGHRIPD